MEVRTDAGACWGKSRKENEMRKWTKDDLKQLKKEFPNHSTPYVAHLLNRSIDAVKAKASQLGLKKTKKYLKTIGRA
jgi:hypothetical protein